MPLDADAARANLTAWARAGITLVRDTGSAGGLTLRLGSGPGLPAVQAAGRFLAPAGRYFPDLLVIMWCEVTRIGSGCGCLDRGARKRGAVEPAQTALRPDRAVAAGYLRKVCRPTGPFDLGTAPARTSAFHTSSRKYLLVISSRKSRPSCVPVTTIHSRLPSIP